MRELTESETVELAETATEYNLYELVGEEAKKWDDEKRKQEAYTSAEIIVSESSYHPEIQGIIFNRTMTLVQDDIPRAPMRHLSFDSPEKAVNEGYWPNSMDKWECREILEEMGIEEFTGYYQDACMEVERGIVTKLLDY